MFFKRKINKKGQVVSAEYVMVFFLIITTMTSMSIYIRRALQARVFDARQTMADMVADGANVHVTYEYEPYYTDSQTNVARLDYTEKKLDGFDANKVLNSSTGVSVRSNVLTPLEAK